MSKPISLYPPQLKFAVKRSLELQMSTSRYIQRLIQYDREHNLIADILNAEARRDSQ